MVLAVVVLSLMVDTPPADAFPGANGLIVAERCDDGAGCSAQHLWTLDARSGARVQLTSGPDRDEDPSFSPDGRRIVFDRCPVRDHCRIATVAATGNNETDVTPRPRVGHDESPSFSPDGSQIVFTRTERTGRHLFAMTANGYNVRRLTSGRRQDRGAVFSPDCSSLVFERYQTGVGFRIFKLAATGGAPSPLTSGPGDYSPSVSPDGSRIVFARRTGTGSAIWIMAADGSRERALTAPRAGVADAQPTFSPDGSRILFNRLDPAQPASESLMVMDTAARRERPITPSSDFFRNPDWQPIRPDRRGAASIGPGGYLRQSQGASVAAQTSALFRAKRSAAPTPAAAGVPAGGGLLMISIGSRCARRGPP